MTGIIPIRNRLAYPAGVAPGFYQAHPASKNCRLSTVTSGANHINILRGTLGTRTGSPSASMHSILGPAVQNAVNTTTGMTFSGMPAVADAEFTMAGIIQWETTTQDGCAINNYSGSDGGVSLHVGQNTGNVLTVTKAGIIDIASGITVPVNEPWFIVCSNKDGVALRFAARNLLTGRVFSSSTSSSGTSGTSNGTYTVGNRGGFSHAINIAASMFSTKFLSLKELEAWAEDPWSFWYPNINDVGIHLLSSSSPRTPVFDTVTRVYPL